MVGNNTKRHIVLFIIVILNTCDFRNLLHSILNRINFKDIINTLHNASKSFETHTGIDILLCKFGIIAVTVIVELAEYIVPELGESVALATWSTIRRTATVFFTTVKINFRARSARTRAVFPEVIRFTETNNVRRVYAVLLCPNFKSFVIVFVNSDIKFVNRHFENFCTEFPRPSGCFFFEVITEREVTEHFKESAVTGSFAYLLNIGSSDTLLTSGNSVSRRSNLTGKIFFHRSHTRVDEEKALIIIRH